MPMFGYGSDMNGWNYGLMTVVMLVFWGLIIVGVVLLVRRSSTWRAAPTPPPSPQELLSARFANGDIDGTEYAERLETLREHTRS